MVTAFKVGPLENDFRSEMAKSKAMGTLFSPTENPTLNSDNTTENSDNPTENSDNPTENSDNPTENSDNPTKNKELSLLDRSPRASFSRPGPGTTKGGQWRTGKQVARFLKQGQTRRSSADSGPSSADSGLTQGKTGPTYADSGPTYVDSGQTVSRFSAVLP